jgi:hypothetical protein
LREIALHILDIAENSVNAGAKNITITIRENMITDRLKIAIEDDGKGMDPITAASITDPFVTTRTTRRVGLGIPLLKAAAEACYGSLTIESALGQGTTLNVEFQHSHIDRMPLGDLPGTFLTLLVGYPDVHWLFHCSVNEQKFIFDDAPIKQELDGLPLTEPGILAFIRNLLSEGISSLQQTAPNKRII